MNIQNKGSNCMDISNWIDLQNRLFPVSKPEICYWYSTKDIFNILEQICWKQISHMFFPEGGGFDLVSVKLSQECGFIEINNLWPNLGIIKRTDNIALVKPKFLSFHSFPLRYDMSFFWLESEILSLLDSYSKRCNFQPLLEFDGIGNYHDIEFSTEEGYYHEDDRFIPLPNDARRVDRYISGKFVIFAKASDFNKYCKYDGKHNQMSEIDFREAIVEIIDFQKNNPLR